MCASPPPPNWPAWPSSPTLRDPRRPRVARCIASPRPSKPRTTPATTSADLREADRAPRAPSPSLRRHPRPSPGPTGRLPTMTAAPGRPELPQGRYPWPTPTIPSTSRTLEQVHRLLRDTEFATIDDLPAQPAHRRAPSSGSLASAVDRDGPARRRQPGAAPPTALSTPMDARDRPRGLDPRARVRRRRRDRPTPAPAQARGHHPCRARRRAEPVRAPQRPTSASACWCGCCAAWSPTTPRTPRHRGHQERRPRPSRRLNTDSAHPHRARRAGRRGACRGR